MLQFYIQNLFSSHNLLQLLSYVEEMSLPAYLHCEHEVLPLREKVPAGQFWQDVALPKEKAPGEQGRHEVEPIWAVNWPARHAWQVPPASLLHVPTLKFKRIIFDVLCRKIINTCVGSLVSKIKKSSDGLFIIMFFV